MQRVWYTFIAVITIPIILGKPLAFKLINHIYIPLTCLYTINVYSFTFDNNHHLGQHFNPAI